MADNDDMRGKPVMLLLVGLLGLGGCAGRGDGLGRADTAGPALSPKIELDLSDIDAQGLRGPADGKVAVSYEFAIPDTLACRQEVRRIDPTVRFMAGSRGRVGAGSGQCLCIGSTHQRQWRRTLEQLARLPYIRRIIECHFE